MATDRDHGQPHDAQINALTFIGARLRSMIGRLFGCQAVGHGRNSGWRAIYLRFLGIFTLKNQTKQKGWMDGANIWTKPLPDFDF